ncbi:MAG TPA: HD domain-containing phosphohydrolase [Bryobacteraceae bacterium]|jgi:FixJ family two-component response regulator
MYVETKIESLAAPPDTRPAVLCVDDDPCILDGFRRQFRKRFRIITATGPVEGLQVLSQPGPFGVVMADLQMPGMDGVQFLSKVRAALPEAVRVMLTGRADISTAMAAVNQGNIFRFLVKPCPHVVIEKVLDAALEQYALQTSERQLTQETLLGCIQVLVEVLSIVQPEAFSRASRVRRHVREIASIMQLADTWQLEAAAMLSQIGWITLQPAILSKAIANQPMSDEERIAFFAHASAAARILEKIPRLGPVAKIIESQHVIVSADVPPISTFDSFDAPAVSAQILKAAIDYDILRQRGMRRSEAIDAIQPRTSLYMPQILAAIWVVAEREDAAEIRTVPLSHLAPGMVLEQSLHSDSGLLLLAKGEEVTATFVARLESFSYGLRGEQEIKVRP